MSPGEAALILGTTIDEIHRLQSVGDMPDPIPDDYLDAVVKFRIDLEGAMRRRLDRKRGLDGEAVE